MTTSPDSPHRSLWHALRVVFVASGLLASISTAAALASVGVTSPSSNSTIIVPEGNSLDINGTAYDLTNGEFGNVQKVVIWINGTNKGNATFTSTGGVVNWTYTWQNAPEGTHTVRAVVTTTPSGTAETTRTFTITHTNTPPIAYDLSLKVFPEIKNFLSIFSYEKDTGQRRTFEIVTPPSHGTAAVESDGLMVTYTADPGYSGPDSMTYRVFDGIDYSEVKTCSLRVHDPSNPRDVPPKTSHSVGVQRCLVIIVDWPDAPQNQASFNLPSRLETVAEIAEWFRSKSAFMTDLEFTVVPQFVRMPKKRNEYTGSTNYITQMTDAVAAATAIDPYYSKSNFDRVWMAGAHNIGSTGKAFVRGKDLWVAFGANVYSRHEFSHTYGLFHEDQNGGAEVVDIGNGITLHSALGLGWITKDDPHGRRYVDATTSGIYRLHDFTSPNPIAGGIRALRLLENRTGNRRLLIAGYDRSIRGALVYTYAADDSYRYPRQIDLTPETRGQNGTSVGSDEGWRDGQIAVGRSYYNATLRATIECLAEQNRGSSYIDIRLTFDGDTPVPYDAPMAEPVDTYCVPGLAYRYFQGDWNSMPNFNSLTPVSSGITDRPNLDNRKVDDEFGFVFEGYLEVPEDTVYTFEMTVNDGARVNIAGEDVLLIESKRNSSANQVGSIGLKAGKHPIRIEYFQKSPGREFHLTWARPGHPAAPIPAEAFRRAAQPLYADAGDDFAVDGNSRITLDGTRSKNFEEGIMTAAWSQIGTGAPSVTLSDATDLTPSFTPSGPGTYRFRLTLTDGSQTSTDEVDIEVTADTTRPTVVSTTASADLGVVRIVFSEPVDPTTASNVANYNLGAGVAINSATVSEDGRVVVLRVTGLGTGTRTLIVNGITDRALPPNAIIANSSRSVTVVDSAFKSWTKRLRITFPAYEGTGTLDHFTVLLRLTPAIAGFAYNDFASSTGGDLRFSTIDGATELKFSIQKWDPAGESLIWVQIPAFGPNTAIWMHYGNAGATTPPAFTSNGGAWHSSFAGVWHLHQNPTGTAPQFKDASANAEHATQNKMAASASVEALVGKGLELDGTDDYAQTDNIDWGSGDWTYSIWYRSTHDSNTGSVLLGGRSPSTYAGGIIALNRDEQLTTTALPGGQSITDSTATNDGQWHHAALSIDADGEARLYRDGTLVGTMPVWSSNWGKDHPLRMGFPEANPVAWKAFKGTIDEVRLAKSARSADWIAAEYLNLSNPGGFAAFHGSGQVPPPAAPSRLVAKPLDAKRIELTWRDNSGNETGFVVQRSQGGGAWTTVATTAANANTYVDSGLIGSTRYGYRVSAQGASGRSSAATASATTFSPLAAWLRENFSAIERTNRQLTDLGADLDEDGLTTFAEYGFAGRVRTKDQFSPVNVAIEDGYLVLTYRRNKDADDVIFSPMATAGLRTGTWTQSGLVTVQQIDQGDHWLIKVRDSIPVDQATRRFMMLRMAQ